MYDDILVPFDGSDGATAVLEHAADVARWADATLHLLYVADTTRDSVTVVQGRAVDALVREGESVLGEAEGTLAARDVDATTDVVQGNPATAIVEYADEYDHDLLVMATHGREGVSRFLLGSVSEKVVRLATVPVLTARLRPDERLAFPYEDVLVPTDGSSAADRAADHALSLAAALDATVHVLSVVEDGSPVPDALSSDADEAAAAADAVDDVIADAEARGVAETVRHVERGSPAEAILGCVEANGVDAVVMGTTGRRGTDRILLGSVAEKTVRAAPVPVLTIREDS